jgi:NO-binding membrane sensor protein with MHYT domain
MVDSNTFSYGLLTPALSYAMSCTGCFLGLRCTVRARAAQGASRARWLSLAALSIGIPGVWGMHFVAMLGYTIPGQAIRYSVPVTVLSMLIAVVVVSAGLFIVGFGGDGLRPLLTGGVIIGLGVASMHYIGMSAMRMPETMHYNVVLVILSVIIAVVTGTVALLAALRLDSVWSAFGACLIMGVAVNGMHFTGMAALRLGPVMAGSASPQAGATAGSFIVPLIFGISVLTMMLTAAISLSPTEAEIRKENEFIERLASSYDWQPGHPPETG